MALDKRSFIVEFEELKEKINTAFSNGLLVASRRRKVQNLFNDVSACLATEEHWDLVVTKLGDISKNLVPTESNGARERVVELAEDISRLSKRIPVGKAVGNIFTRAGRALRGAFGQLGR